LNVVSPEGESLGIMSREEALAKAKESGLDLVLVSDKANPPVAKITEAGKYLYQQKKKHRVKKSGGAVKVITLKFNISPHDLETKLNQTKTFLEKGHQVQIAMKLRGRENALRQQAEEKVADFVKKIQEDFPLKVQNQSSPKSRQIKVNLTK
jgi:translation initiation factor IF-3